MPAKTPPRPGARPAAHAHAHALPSGLFPLRLASFAAVLFGLVAPFGCGSGPNGGGTELASCQVRACQEAVSRERDGSCRYRPVADGTRCDDGDACTNFQSCSQGACDGGVPSPDGTPCDDQNACTTGDACAAGRCVATTPVVCPAANACRGASLCDPKTGCADASYPACVENLKALTLTGCVENVYAAPVTLGGQTFQLLADTGSSTTAVAASGCSSCAVSPNYSFGSGQASFGAAAGRYSDGSAWNGSIVQNSALPGSPNGVNLGPAVPLRFVAITAQQNNFFAGASCSGTQDHNAYQGILGLGTQAGAVAGTRAFLDGYVASLAAPHDAFALQLCQLGGKLWLGGYNPDATGAPPTFTPLLGSERAGAYYAVALDDVAVGKASLGLPSFSYGATYIDTGTGPMLLPQPAYDQFVKRLQADPNFQASLGDALYAAPQPACTVPQPNLTPQQVDAALPPLRLTFPSMTNTAGTALSLSATQSYLTVRIKRENGVDRYTYCTAVYPSNLTTLGAAVLRGFTVVFDRAGQKVGFAPQRGCSDQLPLMPNP